MGLRRKLFSARAIKSERICLGLCVGGATLAITAASVLFQLRSC